MADFDGREQAAFERVVALFASVDPTLAVSDGTWTVRDVLAHLCNVARRYTSVPRLAKTVREVDGINAEELLALDGLAVPELLEKFGRAFARYREVWVGMAAEHMWPFHGGGQLPTVTLRANWLGEMLVHGYDVARAAGVDWSISAADAADLLELIRRVAPSYSRGGAAVVVEYAGDGAVPWVFVSDSDGVRTEASGRPVDAVVQGPADALVLLTYKRIGLDEAERRGLAVSGDRSAVVRMLEQQESP